MAVPDWPTSYGYNMFALPLSTWLTGGVFHEHTHRLWASLVGVLVVVLTRWLGGLPSRRPLIIIGAAEIGTGMLLLNLGADWKGAGHFLAGIGGLVLLAGVVWVKNAPATGRLPLLGWVAFGLVQLQGLLGGLRVVLDAQLVGDVRLGTAFGIFHGCLGQIFLLLVAAMALQSGRWWQASSRAGGTLLAGGGPGANLPRWFLFTTVLIFVQLIIGATMRHQHAGLAISDFPLAHGKLWPAMDADSVARYNQQRIEVVAAHPITAFQIGLQMAHRLMALLILAGVGLAAWRARGSNSTLLRIASFWAVLILIQAGLGAWTIWSNKAADVATAHVLVGALSLVTGTLGCIIAFRRLTGIQETRPAAVAFNPTPDQPLRGNPATAVNQ